jgi:hypothetical protein
MNSMMSSYSTTTSFVDLLDRFVPVQSSLLRQLEIRDIIALSRTCRRLNHVYHTTLRTQYNINDALKPYFKSPIEFRQVQAKTDAIFCEEAALCFLLRKPLTETTGRLSILVEKGSSMNMMRAYLLEDGWVETEAGPAATEADLDSVRLIMKQFRNNQQLTEGTDISFRKTAPELRRDKERHQESATPAHKC